MSVYDKKFCFCGRSKDFKKMMTFIVVVLVILSQFVGNVHASTCHNNTCVENTYFSETLECVQCPSGKSSRAGAIFCSKCDTMYLLSTHCTFPVLGLILLGVFIITMMAVLYSFYRYRHRQEEIKRRLRIDLYRHKRLVKTKQTDISLLTSAWYLSEDEVRLDKKLASGASGDVWKGALRSNWVVAIKKVKTSNMNARRRKSSATSTHRRRRHSSLIDKQLQRGIKEGENTNKNSGWVFDIEEVHFLMRTRHERLVMFLGCGMIEEEPDSCFIVMEYMDCGSLDKPLWFPQNTENAWLSSWTQRVQILSDVAEALAYLHLIHKSIHQDIKSPNVLLERVVPKELESVDDSRIYHNITRRAKLADFNVSKIFSKSKKRQHVTALVKNESGAKARRAAHWIGSLQAGFKGTARWMAPELMARVGCPSPSVDIFSFGILMWEVWARQKPWNNLKTEDVFVKVRDEKEKLKPPLHLKHPKGYDALMRRCWQHKIDFRPLIDIVIQDLVGMMPSAARLDALGIGYSNSSHRMMLEKNRKLRRRSRSDKLKKKKTFRMQISKKRDPDVIENGDIDKSKTRDNNIPSTKSFDKEEEEHAQVVVELKNLDITSESPETLVRN